MTPGKGRIYFNRFLKSDNLIFSVLAHHKTDAIFCIFNTDHYDDKDVILTNHLDSYDRLIAFGENHALFTDSLFCIQKEAISLKISIIQKIKKKNHPNCKISHFPNEV